MMKRIIALLLVSVMLLSLCACGATPKEKLPEEIEEYISENYRIEVGTAVSEPVNVDVASIVDISENEWAVLGTYTVKVNQEIMSAKFGLVATYDEDSEEFIYTKEEFDNFK